MMGSSLLSFVCKKYVQIEEILIDMERYDDESLNKVKEDYKNRQKKLLQELYHETKRLGGDEPREQSNAWDNEPARVIVHHILVKARELDFANVSYEDYVDKDSLKTVLDQLDCCCRHKDKLKK